MSITNNAEQKGPGTNIYAMIPFYSILKKKRKKKSQAQCIAFRDTFTVGKLRKTRKCLPRISGSVHFRGGESGDGGLLGHW